MVEITNINQLLPFVAQKPEFRVLDKGDYQVIDYMYQDSGTFDIPELMECRGIKFCPDGLILARPFRKFFNYGERGSDLPVHRPHVVTHKLDGSMIHPVLLARRLFFHTRKGHTDVALKAERYVLSTPEIGYQDFCIDAIKNQWTPIFEFTSPNNRIVLRYEEDALTLIAMRQLITGEIMPREHLISFSSAYKVPVVEVLNMTLPGHVNEFVQHTRELVGAEGYVVYFDDGYMVKIKAEDYVLKHRALDGLESKKKVVALCGQGFMDDVLPILSDVDAEELLAFNDAFHKEISLTMNEVDTLGSMYQVFFEAQGEEGKARKEFAMWMNQVNVPKHLRAAAFSLLDDKDARLLMINHFIKHHDTVKTEWRGE